MWSQKITNLGICSIPYPVLLGLDWLKQHNPAIDWTRRQLSLSCCGLSSIVPTFGKGYGFLNPSAACSTLSIASVGIGYGLNNLEIPSVLGNMKNLCSSKSYPAGIFTNLQATFSILCPPIPNGLGRTKLKSIWFIPPVIPNHEPSIPIDIAFVDPEWFHKYAKNQEIGCIWYTTNSDLDVHINSLTVEPYDPESPPPEPPPVTADINDSYQDVKNSVPHKYHNYLDVFSPTKVMWLPDHQLYDIDIDLEEGKTPPFGPIYSLSQDEWKALFEYIEHNLSKGFIRWSTSSAASPILFIKWKTGDLCLCVNYQGLNAITKKNWYSLPLTNNLIDCVQGCDKFTVINLKNAFNLICVKEGDEWKTAFRTHLGLFEYMVMPFGLTNTLATFQSLIQDTLHDILDIYCVVYLDDILVFSHPGQDHDNMVKQVFKRLCKAWLFANAKKCEFDKTSVEYLCFIISSKGVQMNPKSSILFQNGWCQKLSNKSNCF